MDSALQFHAIYELELSFGRGAEVGLFRLVLDVPFLLSYTATLAFYYSLYLKSEEFLVAALFSSLFLAAKTHNSESDTIICQWGRGEWLWP